MLLVISLPFARNGQSVKVGFFANLSAGRGEKMVRFSKGRYCGRRQKGLKKKGGFFLNNWRFTLLPQTGMSYDGHT